MSKIVSLSRARKDRARDARKQQGDQNAARFGRTKAEKLRDAAEAAKAARDLEGHRKE
ncbi:MAG: DUF4169 family protein [Jannaschia sp.]